MEKLIQVIQEGDALFGKAFTFLREEGEHVLVEIRIGAAKLERVFHKDHVQEISNNVPSAVTVSELEASKVVLETAPAPKVESSTDDKEKTKKKGKEKAD